MTPPSRDQYYQSSASPQARDVGPMTDSHLKLLIRTEVEAGRRESDACLLKSMDEKFKAMTDTFLSAFPNNDPSEHRRAHERDIEVAQGWAKIRADILSKLLQGGVWMCVVWLVMAAWESFRDGVQK